MELLRYCTSQTDAPGHKRYNAIHLTFGYLGSAASFPETILIAGSVGSHFATHFNSGWSNEFSDHNMIKLGIDWYDGYDIPVRWGTG